jgi:DNA-binding NtrC family response regulator
MLKPDIPTDELTRIIVAESNVGERDAYCRRLGDRKEFSVRGASDWPSISALLDDRRYDVVILGSNVGGVSGIEINSTINHFAKIRRRQSCLTASGVCRPR